MENIRKIMHVLTKIKYNLIAIRYIIIEEFEYDSNTCFFTKMNLLFRGFISDKGTLYDLEKNNIDLYLPDFQRRKTQMINGKHSILLDDKNLFEFVLKNENVVPETYGRIHDGRILLESVKASTSDLISLINDQNSIIIKKNIGGGGKGIYRVESDKEGIIINNDLLSEVEFTDFLNDLDDSIVSEHLQQADYSNEIYPGTINTIRMLIMKDPETNKSFIATAVHKFGAKATEPADNVWRGGLTSLVDLDTGTLGKPALHKANNKEIEWVDVHPDTKMKVEGTQIPNWDQIKLSILELTNKLENIYYVGWDVAITNDGYKIIEGNNYSDVNILQIHQPLLKDERVKSFYKHHDII